MTADGIREALLGGLAYLTVVPALVFLAIPALKSRRFVRFHAWQSVFFAIIAAAAALLARLVFAVLSIVPGIGFLAAWLSAGVTLIALTVTWLALLVKALQGESFDLPILGSLAARLTE